MFWDRGSINLIQPVNIQNVIWERQSTVSANLFSTVIFGLKDWLQKVESSHCGWETKESRAWTPNLFRNQLVYWGFLNRRASRNIRFPSQMMASLMWSKRTFTTFLLAIRIAISQQNLRRFHPVANHTSTLYFILFIYLFILFFFVFITYLTTHVPSWVKMATGPPYCRPSCNISRNMTGIGEDVSRAHECTLCRVSINIRNV